MRIRSIKPEFWQDADLAELPDTVRLFYVGTWQLADDAGWMRWDVAEIGHMLYGYQPRRRRERWIVDRARVLEEAGKLRILPCGHAVVPNLDRHQKLGGRPVFTVRDAHARSCAPLRAAARDESELLSTEGKGRGGEGKEGKGGPGGKPKVNGEKEKPKVNGKHEVTRKKDGDGIPVEKALREAEKHLDPAVQDQIDKARRAREAREEATK